MAIPDPAVVVLVGPSAAGKSTWAAARYRRQEIVSSDELRGIVGSGENDIAASSDALRLLDQIVRARIGRGLATVVDTLGMDAVRRREQLALANAARLPAVVVVFDTDAAECRRRNRARDRPVPAAVLDAQLRRIRDVPGEIAGEGWDIVVPVARGAARAPPVSPRPAQVAPASTPGQLGFRLHISRFPWDDDPAGWLASVAAAAREAGFEGISLTDHLIQIPQVGRAWEPIPQPWVTLGFLAGLAPDLLLGTLVTPVTFRAPGLLAKTVATLDALAPGRTFCGIGAGWWDREHAAFGLPFPPAARRLDQLETAVETLRALWQPGTRAYAGARVSLPETTCYPRPAGRVPIIIGGSGEKRTLGIAARLGDGCNIPSDLDVVDRKVAVLREHCRDVGRDPGEVSVTVLDVPVVGHDRDDVASRVERLRGRTSAAAYARQHHAGTTSDHRDRYRSLAGRGVATVFLALPDLTGPDDILRMSPMIAAFSG